MYLAGVHRNQDSIDNHQHLIFLISLPRSGSTLLQRIIGGHKDIHTTAEPWLMLHPFHALKAEKIKSQLLKDLRTVEHQINGDLEHSQAHGLNVSFPGVDSEALMVALK